MVSFDKIETVMRQKRVVILGIGNNQRGDDGAGTRVAQTLIERQVPGVIDGSDIPESYTAEIKSLSPELILFVDAVDFGGAAGDVILTTTDKLGNSRMMSHKPSLSIMSDYLTAETQAEILLLGIQPKSTHLSTAPSQEVLKTVSSIVELIEKSIVNN